MEARLNIQKLEFNRHWEYGQKFAQRNRVKDCLAEKIVRDVRLARAGWPMFVKS